MRVLLVGAGGMLAGAMQRAAPPTVDLLALSRAELDVSDADAVEAVIDRQRPDWVINCAAYTKVDQAESAPDVAYRVNGVGAVNLAAASRRAHARMLHISTDYVFDGGKNAPYREDDPPTPLSTYGRSKLVGETAVGDILAEKHLIVRTQWLFGAGGTNFVDTILHLARERSSVRVANDQFGRPTYATDLAGALWSLIGKGAGGVLHVANQGVASWFDVAVVAIAATGGRTRVEPCTTNELARAAARPPYSVLDSSRYRTLMGAELRPWQEALRDYVSSKSTDPDTTPVP